jgi:CheY-like chemotaxis protein
MFMPHLHVPSARVMGKRILVAEDEALVAMLIEDELLDTGAKVVGVTATIGEALRLVETAVRGPWIGAIHQHPCAAIRQSGVATAAVSRVRSP